jgi:hypothetical protein
MKSRWIKRTFLRPPAAGGGTVLVDVSSATGATARDLLGGGGNIKVV